MKGLYRNYGARLVKWNMKIWNQMNTESKDTEADISNVSSISSFTLMKG